MKKFDLTAASLVWTIFQTRHTTNNLYYYSTSTRKNQGESLFTCSLVAVCVSDDWFVLLAEELVLLRV
ncbi:TPA: hypothetical protein ACIRHP_000899, partial [Streptococcus suis]